MTTSTAIAGTITPGMTAGTTTVLNTYRDLLKATSEAWTSYGTGASWTAASVNPAIGNGTWAGAYMQVNKLVMVRVVITMGSTTTYGTGQWRVALPVAPKTGVRWSFQAEGLDAGVNQYTCRGVADGSTVCNLFRVGNPDAAVTSAVPHAWGNTDVLTVMGSYEAA